MVESYFPGSVRGIARLSVESSGSRVNPLYDAFFRFTTSDLDGRIASTIRGGKSCYYINDGVYHTFSGQIFDHAQYPLKSFRKGPTQICSVFGPTCDALDTISLTEELPDLDPGELLYAENIGASAASSTSFNGFPPAKVVHVNHAVNLNQETAATN